MCCPARHQQNPHPKCSLTLSPNLSKVGEAGGANIAPEPRRHKETSASLVVIVPDADVKLDLPGLAVLLAFSNVHLLPREGINVVIACNGTIFSKSRCAVSSKH